jgi:hypothetical protein
VVSHYLPTTVAQAWAQVRSCGICGGQIGTGAGFCPSTLVSPANHSTAQHSPLPNTHHHPSSGAGTVGEMVTEVPSGLTLTPPQENKNYYKDSFTL